MTRKDTILISVVINAGLLAILLVTATIYDTDSTLEPTELPAPVSLSTNEVAPPLTLVASTGDEVDNVLNYYTPSTTQPIVIQPQAEVYLTDPVPVQAHALQEEEIPPSPSSCLNANGWVEVTVRKGDALDKIARANGTTVNALMKANHLQSERLSIGQVVKIPPKRGTDSATICSSVTVTTTPKKVIEPKETTASNEPVYYVLKSGDSPWKIAKLFNVSAEDIMRLNQLNEEKARNLKVGDRIRVK